MPPEEADITPFGWCMRYSMRQTMLVPAALKALAWRYALPAGEEFPVPAVWPLAARPGEHRARMEPFWPGGRPARSAAQSSKPWAWAIAEADSEMPDGTGHQRRPVLRVGRF